MRLLNLGKGASSKSSRTTRQRQQSRRPRLCARRMRQMLLGTGVATLIAIVTASGWHAARTGALDKASQMIATLGADISNELGIVVSDILVEGRYRTERNALLAAIATDRGCRFSVLISLH